MSPVSQRCCCHSADAVTCFDLRYAEPDDDGETP